MQNRNENSPFRHNYSLNLNGFLLDLSTVKVMGILNITPDSFYDGGNYLEEKNMLKQVESMLDEGADIIDIGAFSSRPSADLIDYKEEHSRLLPVVKSVVKHFPKAILSVDTYRAAIAKEVISEGAHIINDISGGQFDKEMFKAISELKVPYVLMHMQGKPKDMQIDPQYKNVCNEVYHFFTEQLNRLNSLGVADVILDVGFGFGKQLTHNYELLNNLRYFHSLERPLLIGLSRKGMIQKVINREAKEALNGTVAANVIALQNGANILRVHDVKAANDAIAIVDYCQKL